MRTWFSVLAIGVAAGALFTLVQTVIAEPAQQSSKPARPLQPAAAEIDLADDVNRLRQRKLTIPVQGVLPKNIVDTFNAQRGAGKHEANDMLAALGTPVYAVDDGKIEKLFTSKAGGLTIYQFDKERVYCYYYAHLDHYAADLRQGAEIKRGDLLGYVGVTGNAGNTPHLHFAIFKLGSEKKWWQGTALNPYPILREGIPSMAAAHP
jgi:murein DD-endopeptidase MepM/ murein hydrolase activator NlpD